MSEASQICTRELGTESLLTHEVPITIAVNKNKSDILEFLHDFLGQVWYLIVSIPDFCLPLYFGENRLEIRVRLAQ